MEQPSVSFLQEVVSTSCSPTSLSSPILPCINFAHLPSSFAQLRAYLGLVARQLSLGDFCLKTQESALLIFIQKRCGKEVPVDLHHFKSPTPGALQPHTVRLTFVAETVSCLTREFLKRLPRDVVVELFVFSVHVCVHIGVPAYMSVWGPEVNLYHCSSDVQLDY